MELDDFKNTWQQADGSVTVNENVNLKAFTTMSKKRVYRKLRKIVLPEMLGSVVCVGSAVFLGFNFYKLTSAAFQITGIITIALLILLTVVSILSIQQLYTSADITAPYAGTLKEFALKKVKFCKLQKLNLTLCYLLFVSVIILVTRLFGRNTITDSKYFFIISYSAGYIILAAFSRWVFKNYNKTISKTEALLNELSAQP